MEPSGGLLALFAMSFAPLWCPNLRRTPFGSLLILGCSNNLVYPFQLPMMIFGLCGMFFARLVVSLFSFNLRDGYHHVGINEDAWHLF